MAEYIENSTGLEISVEEDKKKLQSELVQRLILYRKELGLSQQNIADATGMKRSNISRIESMKYTPSLDVILRYAKAVGMNVRIDLEKISES